MGAVLKDKVETLPPHQTEVFLAVLEQLRWFAGLQIRNVAVSSFVYGSRGVCECVCGATTMIWIFLCVSSGCWWKHHDSQPHLRSQPCFHGRRLQTYADGQR